MCFFFKQKTAYEMRISDWSSDVCSSDLLSAPCLRLALDRANTAGLAIEFRQGDGQTTGLAENSVDLITSTMFIHEIPRPALVATLAECARVLDRKSVV